MKSIFSLTFSTLCLLVLVGCKTSQNLGKKEANSTSSEKAEVELDLKPIYVPDPAPYHPSEEKIHDLLHTKLWVSFDWQNQYVLGKAHLTLKPYFYPQSDLVLDAKGFEIQRVNLIKGDVLKPLEFSYEDSLHLVISLDTEYSREDTLKVEVKYIAKPNELKDKGGSSAITRDLGLYFINPLGEEPDKPQQIWTQGETEASSCWFPTLDQPNEKTTQEMYITVGDSMVTLSNGSLQHQVFNADGTRTDYWKQDKPHAPYLFMMAIGKFAVVKDKWKDLEVDYYVEPKFEPHARAVFGNTPEMLEFFSNKLGYEYPWDKYSQVVVRDFVSGAMENTSASIFMEQLQITTRETLDKNWDYIIAHELFHHWFGDLVTCESWANLALNESFANYSEYLWSEYKDGRDHADKHRMDELEGYMRQAMSAQYPIIRYNYRHRMDMFDSHSYNKGGLVLHMLRKLLGDDAFFESLKNYLHKNEYTDAEIHELRMSFEDVTGQDLKWFFDQWFLSPGHPSISVTDYYRNDTLFLDFVQAQDSLYTPIYRLPMKVATWEKGKKTIHSIEIDQAQQTVAIPLGHQPTLVVVDEEQQILGDFYHTKPMEEWASAYKWSDKFQVRYNALDTMSIQLSLVRQLKSVEQEPSAKIDYSAWLIPMDSARHAEILQSEDLIFKTLRMALEDSFGPLREKAVNLLASYLPDENVSRVQPNIEKLAQNDPESIVRAAAFTFLSDRAESHEQLENLFAEGLKDSSYSVIAAALPGFIESGNPEAPKIISEFKESSQPKILNGVASFYVESKDSSQFPWLVAKYEASSSVDKISFVKYLARFVEEVDSSKIDVALETMEAKATAGDDIYTRFSGYLGMWMLDDFEGVRERRKAVIAKEENHTLLRAYEGRENSLK